MKKRILCMAAAILSLLLIFCFAACGGKDKETEPSDPEQEEEQNEEQKEEENKEEQDIPREPELDPNLRPVPNPHAGKTA